MEVHQEKKSACGKFRDDWEFETMFGKMGRNDLEAVSCQFRTWIFICILHKVLLCLYFPEICIIFGLPSCGLKVLTVFIFISVHHKNTPSKAAHLNNKYGCDLLLAQTYSVPPV